MTRTILEILDDAPETQGHTVKVVRINGQEVRVKQDGISLTYGNGQFTIATVELIVDEVHFTDINQRDEIKVWGSANPIGYR